MENRQILQDFYAALLYYHQAGLSLQEACQRLGVENLGGFYARPPILWYSLDDAAKMVQVDGEVINLTPIEYNILHLLMKNPGRVYSTAQIYQLVWNDPVLGSESTVAVHIRHLREKIEIDPANPCYLKVVWGLGYKMEKMG